MTESWLCPTEQDRQRASDTSARVRRARLLGSGVIGVGTIILAPILSWWLLALFAASLINLIAVDWMMARSSHPYRIAAGSMLFTEGVIAVAVVITGGPHSPVLPLLVVPVAMVAARFRALVVLAGVAIGAVTILGVGLLVDARDLFEHPAPTIVVLALLGNVAAITVAIQGAELQQRTEAVLDPLTGLLNRKALRVRFAELEEQARLNQAAVCVMAADLDHFKYVNDTYGHERGDAVLRDAAYHMRKATRSFELIYRLGGEEFLIVLPNADLAEGLEVAERLRDVVERARPGGLDLTLSLGVAAAYGPAVQYDRLYAAADEALYAAKDAGRNRVAWRPTEPAQMLAPAPTDLEAASG